jgi:hypothetical protein
LITGLGLTGAHGDTGGVEDFVEQRWRLDELFEGRWFGQEGLRRGERFLEELVDSVKVVFDCRLGDVAKVGSQDADESRYEREWDKWIDLQDKRP